MHVDIFGIPVSSTSSPLRLCTIVYMYKINMHVGDIAEDLDCLDVFCGWGGVHRAFRAWAANYPNSILQSEI